MGHALVGKEYILKNVLFGHSLALFSYSIKKNIKIFIEFGINNFHNSRWTDAKQYPEKRKKRQPFFINHRVYIYTQN